MNVFKIQQAPAVKKEAEEKPLTQVSPETEGASPSEEIVVNNNVQEGAPAGAAAPGKEIMVQVDGPVSRIFTDALNRLLAVEGYITVPPIIGKMVEGGEPAVETAPGLVQVYCWRTDAVNTNDLVQLTNEITRHTDREYVVAVEQASTISENMGILEGLAKNPNVKLCYSQESAARYIQGKLK